MNKTSKWYSVNNSNRKQSSHAYNNAVQNILIVPTTDMFKLVVVHSIL